MATDTVQGHSAVPAAELPTLLGAGKSFQRLLPWKFSNGHRQQGFLTLFFPSFCYMAECDTINTSKQYIFLTITF